MTHRSGFINIIGRPNVGKSTLMNSLVGERMSIITNKPQTTRHRIKGIVSGSDFQMVFSDTPGYIEQPNYKMQELMNNYVRSTFEDADLMLFVISPDEDYEEDDHLLLELKKYESHQMPVFLVINKMETISEVQKKEMKEWWLNQFSFSNVAFISAINNVGIPDLIKNVFDLLPEGPEYYPKDQLTDRNERFFVSEIIREKILLLYRQEIPYSCEVIVDTYKDQEEPKPLVRISAYIYVNRETQKFIIIGEGGKAIKRLGIEARKDIEKFVGKQVHLELIVKVRDDWRNNDNLLKQFGYHA